MTEKNRISCLKEALESASVVVDHGGINPTYLVDTLTKTYPKKQVIEMIQQGLEKNEIALNTDGMVIFL